MKVLIIHGPNMNLLGSLSKDRLTLDKLNRSIKKLAHTNNIECKIFQTHNEAKFITLVQRNRNKGGVGRTPYMLISLSLPK